MSNLLTPVDAQLLESVTGGSATRSCSGSSSSDALTQTLTQLQSTISSLGQNNNNNGFSTTEAMMLGLLMSQRNTTVVVRPRFW